MAIPDAILVPAGLHGAAGSNVIFLARVVDPGVVRHLAVLARLEPVPGAGRVEPSRLGSGIQTGEVVPDALFLLVPPSLGGFERKFLLLRRSLRLGGIARIARRCAEKRRCLVIRSCLLARHSAGRTHGVLPARTISLTSIARIRLFFDDNLILCSLCIRWIILGKSIRIARRSFGGVCRNRHAQHARADDDNREN